MSYLLEALQKSQKEREQNVPGIQTPALQVEVPDESPRSPWLYVAIAALVINTILVVYLVFKPSEPVAVTIPAPATATTTATTTAVTAATVPVAPSAAPATAADRVQSRDLDATVAVNETARDINTTAPATIPTVIAPTAAISTPEPAATTSREKVIDVDLFSVPTVNQLADDIRKQLPELEMNSHIYAPSEKDSFVMINGVSLTPGMMLMPNLKLLAITADGAVLQFDEHKFLLPALSSFKP